MHTWNTNQLKKIQMEIPKLEREVSALMRENGRLQFKIDQLEAPERLFELSRRPEFSHLTHPRQEDVIIFSR